jgi:small-conductance mechanosensitive channel
MQDLLANKIFLLACYFSGVAASILVAFFLLRKHLTFLENIRRKRLKKLQGEELLASHINRNVNEKKIKEQSIDSIKKRFTITRRAIYLVIFLAAIILVIAPVLANVSHTLISVVIACVSVVFGIAAKPFIENMICGLVLCFGKLARIGDVVLVDNEYGTIEDVTLTHCIIKRWDWLRYVVPNSLMMTKEFTNYSLRDNHRWVYVEFWIDNNSDLELVEQIAKSAPKTSKYYSDTEEPRFWITELTPQSAKCMAVAWATCAADGWMLSIDVRKNLLLEFKKHGIQTHLQNLSLNGIQPERSKEVKFDAS